MLNGGTKNLMSLCYSAVWRAKDEDGIRIRREGRTPSAGPAKRG